jgi:outer membrane protein TolC
MTTKTITDAPSLRLYLAVPLSLIAGCASSSTRGDYDTVRTLAEQRADLRVVERSPEKFEQPEQDVAKLLARPLTAGAAVRIAFLNNRDLRAALRDLGVARGELVQASLLPNPELEAEVRFPVKRGGEHDGPQWDLGLEFDLTQALLIPKRMGVAEADLEATRYRVAASVLDFGYRVRLAFYDVQALQQQLELQRTMLDALTASYEAARQLHAAGNITALDLATEQAAYEQARISVAEGEAELLDGRERLNVLLGVFGKGTEWQITERLPEPAKQEDELEGLEARAIETSLELAQARAELTAQARRVGLTEAEGWMPDLNVGVRAEHDTEAWEIGPSLSGTLPLFDRQQGRVQSRESEFWALRERYVATAVAVRAAVRAGRNRLLSAQERADHYRTVLLPLRERIVAETLLQYNAMQVGVFQLLQARRDQAATAASYIETLREYWQSRAALDQLRAGRLTGTMARVASTTRETAVPAGGPNDVH